MALDTFSEVIQYGRQNKHYEIDILNGYGVVTAW